MNSGRCLTGNRISKFLVVKMPILNVAEVKTAAKIGEAVLYDVAPETASRLAAEAASLCERGKGVLRSLGIKEWKLPSTHERWSELPHPTNTSYTKKTVPEGAAYAYKSGETSLVDFAASVKAEQAPARLHQLANGTNLIVPTDYAEALDVVRDLRRDVARGNRLTSLFDEANMSGEIPYSKDFDNLKSFVAETVITGQTLPELFKDTQWRPEIVAKALGREALPNTAAMLSTEDLKSELERMTSKISLFKHRWGYAMLPEDVPSLLKTMPDSGFAKTVHLLGESSEPYFAEAALKWKPINSSPNINLDFAAGASLEEGRISYYQPRSLERDAEGLIKLSRHEQTHLNHDPLYGIARSVDSKFEASTYGEWNNKESEAELESISFLSSDVPTFVEATEQAPARMAVLANKLTRTIRRAEPTHRSADAEQILARADWIKQNVVPEQKLKLTEIIKSTIDTNRSKELTRLLDSL